MSNLLFSDFAPVSESAWLARIEKDLKGKPLSDLQWHLNEDIILNPFAHADSVANTYAPLAAQMLNTWEIGENITVSFDDDGLKKANQQTLNALMGGTNAPQFVLPAYPNATQLAILLEGVELNYISVHFAELTHAQNPQAFLETLMQLAQTQGIDPATLRGSVAFNPLQQDAISVIALMRWATTFLPQFKVFMVDGTPFFKGSKQVVQELNNVLLLANQIFEQLTEGGATVQEIAATTTVKLQIGISYFVEIAKLRAFKLLWGNLMAAYGANPIFPHLDVAATTDTQGTDEHTNKIKVTTQAMSAIIAGVQRLTLFPSDSFKETDSANFSRRVARNVQHLLQLESYLDKVADPSAGSYYIESLTNIFAEKAWLN